MTWKEQFTPFLRQIHDLDNTIMEEFLSYWEEINCPRRDVLVAEGETEKYLYFVLEGIQCTLCRKTNREHVIHLTHSPALIAVPESFMLQQPSRYSLECITASRLLRISYRKYLDMMNKNPEVERLIRKALEMIVMEMVQRHYELMAYTIKERFTAFMNRNPELINLVPHKYIASYLNIDPSNFSRLLNQHPI